MQVGDLKQYLNTKFKLNSNLFQFLEILIRFEEKVIRDLFCYSLKIQILIFDECYIYIRT